MNIFRLHGFPLASEDTETAPVNHPALVKTSDQPSFSSANLLPSSSAEALRASDISAGPSLNLQLNPRGGTVTKIRGSSYRNFVEATQKKKIKQVTKSKTNRLASSALLGPSKRRKREHEYGPMGDTMSLLKYEQKTPMLIPYEQLFIQTYHKQGLLIQEQLMGDSNPYFN